MPSVEFKYKNSYHSSIQIALFKALYGRHCRTSVGWLETTAPEPHSIDLVQKELARVWVIQDRLGKIESRH